jgi:tRNA A37 N6-isopentenylltransferase MiaA
MELRPISVKHASAFVQEHHRHHDAPQGAKFALAAWHDGQLVGVAMVGRPVSRMLDDGLTAEVIRVATNGTRNACSFLYGAAKRSAQAMGYRKVVTYTLIEESGASLRAVGWNRAGIAGGGSWSRPSRPEVDHHPLQQKIRWECDL